MLSPRDHWKQVGNIVHSVLPHLLQESHYNYDDSVNIEFTIHDDINEDCSGRCRLVEYDNDIHKIEIDIFPKLYPTGWLPKILFHEVTHALQYHSSLFLGESIDYDKLSSSSYVFSYMTLLSEIDAELSAYYNLYGSFYFKSEEDIVSKLEKFYHLYYCYYSPNLLHLISLFITRYITTGVYDIEYRKELMSKVSSPLQ